MSLLRRRVMGDDKIDWKIEVTEINTGSGNYVGYPHRKVGDTWIINPKTSYMPIDSCVGSSASAGIEFLITITPRRPCPIKIWIDGMVNYVVICTGGWPISTGPIINSSGEAAGRDIVWNYEQEADSLSCNFSTWNGTTSNTTLNMTESSGAVVADSFIHIDITDGSEISEVIKICRKDWYIAIQEIRHYFTYDASLHDGYTGPTSNIDRSWHARLRNTEDPSLYGSQLESPLSSYGEVKGVPDFLIEPVVTSTSPVKVQEFKFKDSAPILVKREVFSNPSSLGVGAYLATRRPYGSSTDASLYHNMYVNSCFALKVITNCCMFWITSVSNKIQRTSIGCNNSNNGRDGWRYVRGTELADGHEVGACLNGVLLDPDVMYDELGNKTESVIWVVFKGHNLSIRDSSYVQCTIAMHGYRGAGLSTSYKVDSSSTGITLWPWAMYKIQNRWTFPRGTSSSNYVSTFINSGSSTLQYYEITYNNAAGATGGTANPSLMELPGRDLTNRYYIGYFSTNNCPNIGSTGLYYQITGSDLVTLSNQYDSEAKTNYLSLSGYPASVEASYGLISFVAIQYSEYYSYSHTKYWRIYVWAMDNAGSSSQHSRDSSFGTTNVCAANGSITAKGWTYTNSSTSTMAAFTYHAPQKAIGNNSSSYMSHYLRPQSFVINTKWNYPAY